MALIEADTESLRTMLADANAQVVIVKAPAEQAKQRVSFARAELAQAENAATEAGLVDYLRRLDGLMLAGLTQLSKVSRRPKPIWGASAQLFDALRTLAVKRGEM